MGHYGNELTVNLYEINYKALLEFYDEDDKSLSKQGRPYAVKHGRERVPIVNCFSLYNN